MFCTFVITGSHKSGNYLSAHNGEAMYLVPRCYSSGKVPLPIFGFLARGVYLVPLPPFLMKLRHCGTFKVRTPYLKDLGGSPAVKPVNRNALAYCLTRHDHYGHFSAVRAWTFLCFHRENSNYPNATSIILPCLLVVVQLISKNVFFKIAQAF